jgi:hypothetical protein
MGLIMEDSTSLQIAKEEIQSTPEPTTDEQVQQVTEELAVKATTPEQQIEQVAQFFKLYMQVFKNQIEGLNSKALKRIITRLVEFPLQEEELTWPFKEEKEIFAVGHRLLEAKYGMAQYVLNDKIQELGTEENKNEGVKEDGEVKT